MCLRCESVQPFPSSLILPDDLTFRGSKLNLKPYVPFIFHAGLLIFHLSTKKIAKEQFASGYETFLPRKTNNLGD